MRPSTYSGNWVVLGGYRSLRKCLHFAAVDVKLKRGSGPDGRPARPRRRRSSPNSGLAHGGYRLILEAVGSAPATIDAIALNGVLLLTGLPNGAGDRERLAPALSRLVLRNRLVVGSVNSSVGHFAAATRDLAAMDERWPEALPALITHRLPFARRRGAGRDRLAQGGRHPQRLRTLERRGLGPSDGGERRPPSDVRSGGRQTAASGVQDDAARAVRPRPAGPRSGCRPVGTRQAAPADPSG